MCDSTALHPSELGQALTKLGEDVFGLAGVKLVSPTGEVIGYARNVKIVPGGWIGTEVAVEVSAPTTREAAEALSGLTGNSAALGDVKARERVYA